MHLESGPYPGGDGDHLKMWWWMDGWVDGWTEVLTDGQIALPDLKA